MKNLFLKDQMGQVIRAFRCEAKKIYLIYRKKTGRLDFSSSLDIVEKEKNPIVLIDQFEVAKLKKSQPIPLLHGFLEVCDETSIPIRQTLVRSSIKDGNFWRIFSFVSLCYLLFAGLLYWSSLFYKKEEVKLPELRVVKIINPPAMIQPEKVVLNSKQMFFRQSSSPVKKKVLKKSLKKMGALSALGSLSKKDSQQKGGLNLGVSKFSFGPGFRAIAFDSGSGGVQDSLYSKGMITAALGSGGNIRGGGGYGTKGTEQGGGSAGYGGLTLIGSGGTDELSFSSALDSQGGSFDFSVIEKEIIKNIGLITLCYDKALKKEPNLKGLFKISFSVNPKGRVVFSKRHPASEVRSAKVSSCILEIIDQIQFPIELPAIASFDYDFDLSSLEVEGGS